MQQEKEEVLQLGPMDRLIPSFYTRMLFFFPALPSDLVLFP